MQLISFKRFSQISGLSRENLTQKHHNDVKSGNKRGRFVKKDGRLYVDVDVWNADGYIADQKEILECEELYFKVREHFRLNWHMCEYFGYALNKSPHACYTYFQNFKFKKNKMRKDYMNAFKDFLNKVEKKDEV